MQRSMHLRIVPIPPGLTPHFYGLYLLFDQRWGVCVQAIRFARVCVEEAMKHAFKRKTFGKLLIEHPVIR
jgi:hypothetical protein